MNFEVKSKEVLEGMEAGELQAYYTAKLSHEKNELDARIEKLEAEKDDAKHDDLAKEVKEMKEETLKTLHEAVREQGIIMQKLREGGLSASSIKDAE
jgi:hypothetical protein